MLKNILYLFISVLVLSSCKTQQDELTAQEIIDKSIAYHGSNVLQNSTLSFKFRDFKYTATRVSGLFSLHRIQKDSVLIEDILTNDGFTRKVEDNIVQLADSMAFKYAESVNSVHYFSVLPFGLNDPAVLKKKLPETTFNAKQYYTIQVTFKQEGGGVDFEDVFMYWISKDNFKVAYLAYKFHVNGGGIRFREATTTATVQGVRFNNYNNYAHTDSTTTIYTIGTAFVDGSLKKVSEINLEDIALTVAY